MPVYPTFHKNEDTRKVLGFIRERQGVLRGDHSFPTAHRWALHVLMKQNPTLHHGERSRNIKRRRSCSPEKSGRGEQPHRIAASTLPSNKSWKDSSPCMDANCMHLIKKKVIRPHQESSCLCHNRQALDQDPMKKHKVHLDRGDGNAKLTTSYEDRSFGAHPVERTASINQWRQLDLDESDDHRLGIDI